MEVLSRHRLPQPYRTIIVVLWLLPGVLLFVALLVGNGWQVNLLHPVLWFKLVAMSAPALYIWQEGVDVTEEGLIIRVRGWRYRRFDTLDTWYLHEYHGGRVLKIWDARNRRVLSCYAAHLTELPILVGTLKRRLRWRGWHT